MLTLKSNVLYYISQTQSLFYPSSYRLSLQKVKITRNVLDVSHMSMKNNYIAKTKASSQGWTIYRSLSILCFICIIYIKILIASNCCFHEIRYQTLGFRLSINEYLLYKRKTFVTITASRKKLVSLVTSHNLTVKFHYFSCWSFTPLNDLVTDLINRIILTILFIPRY